VTVRLAKKKRNLGPEPEPRPHKVHLPGFLIQQDVGLGDLIKKATYAVGIKPCGGCEKRALVLNRWMTLSR
jgi:hypothetical protein